MATAAASLGHAGLQAVLGGLAQLLEGSRHRKEQRQPPDVFRIPLFEGQQKNLVDQLTQQASGAVPDLFSQLLRQLRGDPDDLAAMFAPGRRELNEKILPGIADEFDLLGGIGGSDATGAGYAARANLQERERDKALQSRMGAVGPLLQLLGLARQPQEQILSRFPTVPKNPLQAGLESAAGGLNTSMLKSLFGSFSGQGKDKDKDKSTAKDFDEYITSWMKAQREGQG